MIDIESVTIFASRKSKPISTRASWIADSISSQYDKYSVELLKAVVSLWVTVRSHAFTKGWTMQFERQYIPNGEQERVYKPHHINECTSLHVHDV